MLAVCVWIVVYVSHLAMVNLLVLEDIGDVGVYDDCDEEQNEVRAEHEEVRLKPLEWT